MGTDLLSIEAANQSEQEIWEELMSDDEDKKVKDEAPDALPKPTKRRRPSNKTAEERAAWDRETKDLRNAKAKERRLQKKQEAQN